MKELIHYHTLKELNKENLDYAIEYHILNQYESSVLKCEELSAYLKISLFDDTCDIENIRSINTSTLMSCINTVLETAIGFSTIILYEIKEIGLKKLIKCDVRLLQANLRFKIE